MEDNKANGQWVIALICIFIITASAITLNPASGGSTSCGTITGGVCESQQLRLGFWNHPTNPGCFIPHAQLASTQACVVTFTTPMTVAPSTILISNMSALHTFMDYNYFFQAPSVGQAWAGMPAAQTEIYGNPNHRVIMQMSNSGTWPYCTLLANVVIPGTATAILRAQYSNDTITWSNLFDDLPNTDISIASSGIAIPGLAGLPVTVGATDFAIFLRVVGLNGDGVVSPSFTNIYLQCDWLSLGQQPYYSITTTSTTTFSVVFSTNLAPPPVDTPIRFSYEAVACLTSSC